MGRNPIYKFMKKILNFCRRNSNRLIFCLFCFAFAYTEFLTLSVRPLDTDIFWHYKLGEEVLSTGRVTLENTMSFILGTEWVPQEWLYEIGLYAIVSSLGALGLFVLYAVNTTMQAVISERFAKPKHIIWFCIAASVVLLFTPRNAWNRPSELSVYLFPLIVLLYRKKPKFSHLYFILLGVFTANFHGGCILVMTAIFILMLVCDLFLDICGKKFSGFKYYRAHLVDLLLFLGSTCINPAGVRLLTTIPRISGLDSTKYISEWKSLSNSYYMCVIILAIAISLGFALFRYRFSRKEFPVIMVLTALLILSMHSVKGFIIFDMVWLCFGYRYLEEMLDSFFQFSAKPKLKKISLLLFLTIQPAVFTLAYGVAKSSVSDMENKSLEDYANSKVDGEIISCLKENYTPETKILTSYNGGNYLIMNDMKCFVDSRQWPYAKELGESDAVDELFYISTHAADFQSISEFLNEYEFDYIWCNKDLRIEQYLAADPDYEKIMGTEAEKPEKFYEADDDDTSESLWIRKEI